MWKLLGLILLLVSSAAAVAEEAVEERPLRDRARLEPRASSAGKTLFRRPGERRPEDQRSFQLFGRELTVGGEYEFRTRFEGGFRLDDDALRPDDAARADQKLEIEAAYWLSERAILFLEGQYLFRADVYREDRMESSQGFFERGETWLYLANLLDSPFSLQLGRQRFSEGQEWFYDEDFDAIRVHADFAKLHAEVAVAERLTRRSTREESIPADRDDLQLVLARATSEWRKGHRIELFAISQRDGSTTEALNQIVDHDREDESDADLDWFGVGLRGKEEVLNLGRLRYWLDLATVRGDEKFVDYDTNIVTGARQVGGITNYRVRGWGVDVGMSWRTKLPGTPTLTLAYAEGSGDRRMTDKTDSGFRQTGFQDNNLRFSGVDRFRRYGEMLEPDLSNLRVTTLALGLPLLRSSSIELLYHSYAQVHRADFLRDTNLCRRPDGDRRRLGREFDLVLGLEEWEQLEIELIGAAFRASSAFGTASGEQSYFGALKVNWNF